MPKRLLALTATSAAVLMSVYTAQARDHHQNRSKDRAIGAAIGLVIGGIAAAASKNRGDRDGMYAERYDDSYAAAPDVICHRDSAQCFRRGYFSGYWTDREFGYDPHRRGY